MRWRQRPGHHSKPQENGGDLYGKSNNVKSWDSRPIRISNSSVHLNNNAKIIMIIIIIIIIIIMQIIIITI